MKIDPNGPVFPHHGSGMFGEPVTHTPGITYRQLLVGMIAQGCAANPECIGDSLDEIAAQAISQADAIVSHLNTSEEPK